MNYYLSIFIPINHSICRSYNFSLFLSLSHTLRLSIFRSHTNILSVSSISSLSRGLSFILLLSCLSLSQTIYLCLYLSSSLSQPLSLSLSIYFPRFLVFFLSSFYSLLQVVGAASAGWTPMRFNEWFDNDFPDWLDTDTAEGAKAGKTEKQQIINYRDILIYPNVPVTFDL